MTPCSETTYAVRCEICGEEASFALTHEAAIALAVSEGFKEYIQSGDEPGEFHCVCPVCWSLESAKPGVQEVVCA